MIINSSYTDIATADGGSMRTFVAAPKREGKYPGIVFFSDIFQLSGPMLRSCARLAGYGFVVAAPEIYHRVEQPGAVIPFDDDGRTRGLANAARTTVAQFDIDCRATLGWLSEHPQVAPGKIGAAGFCLGGHLAFRAALQPEVRATVCFFGTGIHNGKLGADDDAGSLQRVSEIQGDLFLVWGTLDPHIPAEGRELIDAFLRSAGTRFSSRLYPAEHAFMRDEGPRYDSEVTDHAFADMISLYRRIFPR
jgi:carboxymethylenebutenolidase